MFFLFVNFFIYFRSFRNVRCDVLQDTYVREHNKGIALQTLDLPTGFLDNLQYSIAYLLRFSLYVQSDVP